MSRIRTILTRNHCLTMGDLAYGGCGRATSTRLAGLGMSLALGAGIRGVVAAGATVSSFDSMAAGFGESTVSSLSMAVVIGARAAAVATESEEKVCAYRL